MAKTLLLFDRTARTTLLHRLPKVIFRRNAESKSRPCRMDETNPRRSLPLP